MPWYLLALAIVSLAACAPTSITVPVAVIEQNGRILRGTNTASFESATFEVTDGKVTCTGSYDPLNQSQTISMTTVCSDGRKGLIIATREASGISGSGHVRMDDGSVADFVFGDAAARFLASAPASRQPQPNESPKAPDQRRATQGTGFFVSQDGKVLTNAHVVRDCRQIALRTAEKSGVGRVVARDTKNDLALLTSGIRAPSYAKLRPSVQLGEEIVVYGYPLAGLLASGGNVTTGNVAAVSGLGDDSRFLQITAPVQSGNSGGPLLDRFGNVVGVVTSKSDLRMAALIKEIPQNVNFALKSSLVVTFLEANRVSHSKSEIGNALKTADLASMAGAFSLQVVCVQ
jgi:S1-C subfamily serine protease